MPNNVYIGNRYVPVFANPVEWDNLREYEPLTIVTYQGTAYTSRTTVPVGTALSNTDYWVVTGNYNAQVEEYRQAVVQVQNDVDDLSGDFSTFQTSVNEELHDLDTETDLLQFRLTTVETYINNEQSAKYAVWIGDSYTQANSLGQDQDKRFSTLVSAQLGMTEKNYASGSCGYAAGTNTYTQQITAASLDMTTEQKNRTEYVFICGNRNDANGATAQYSYNDITAVVVPTITNACTVFPNAKIIVIPMMWSAQPLDRWATTWYFGVINALDFNPRVTILNNAYMMLFGRFNLVMEDYVHPNVNGHYHIAKCILSAIRGGKFIPDRVRTFRDSSTWNGVMTLLSDENSVMIKARFQPTANMSSSWFIDAQVNSGWADLPCFIGEATDVIATTPQGDVVALQVNYYRLSSNSGFRVYNYQQLESGKIYTINVTIPVSLTA